MLRLSALLFGFLVLAKAASAQGKANATVAGSFSNLVGCANQWQENCAALLLTTNRTRQLHYGGFEIPAGSYEYKVVFEQSWDAGSVGNSAGQNVALVVPASASGKTFVNFVLDEYVTGPGSGGGVWDSINFAGNTDALSTSLPTRIAVVGNFSSQASVGCAKDWDPECDLTKLERTFPSGKYSKTLTLSAGIYDFKIIYERSFDVNYGDGGANGGNWRVTVPARAVYNFIFSPGDSKLAVAQYVRDDPLPTPTATASPSNSASPSITPSISPSQSVGASPSVTPTRSPAAVSPSSSPSFGASPSVSPSSSITPSISPSFNATPSASNNTGIPLASPSASANSSTNGTATPSKSPSSNAVTAHAITLAPLGLVAAVFALLL